MAERTSASVLPPCLSASVVKLWPSRHPLPPSSCHPSGCAATWAHHAVLEDDREGLKWGLLIAVLLGVLFTITQAYEYGHAAFAFDGNIYGANFYMATGFHGFHVIIGTIFLFVCLLRARRGHFTPKQHIGFEAAAWYWHFVDVVWLFLFVCVYIWGGGDPGAH